MSFTFSRLATSTTVTRPASRLLTKAWRESALKAISWWPSPVARVATVLRVWVSITLTPPCSPRRALLPTQR
ncbi:hypothetical protein D9M71_719010 [compost metagenome]